MTINTIPGTYSLMHTIGWCEAGYGSTSVNPDPSGFGHVAVRLDAVYFQFWQERNTLDRYWYLLCAVKNQIEATYKILHKDKTEHARTISCVKLSINDHTVGLVHKNQIVRTRLMYHAACKVEFRPFKRLYSQLTFFSFL